MRKYQESHRESVKLVDQARSLLAQGSDSNAIKAKHLIYKAIEVQPSNCAAWILKSQALSFLGENKAALHAIEIAVRFSPRSAETHYWRSVILTDLNRLSEALKSIDRAMRYLNAEDSWLLEDIFCDKAIILDSLGRGEEAVETYQAGLRQCPRSSLLHSGLAPYKKATPKQAYSAAYQKLA